MKPLDIILTAIIAAAFVFALVRAIKNSKSGCGGNCAECGRSCGRK